MEPNLLKTSLGIVPYNLPDLPKSTIPNERGAFQELYIVTELQKISLQPLCSPKVVQKSVAQMFLTIL